MVMIGAYQDIEKVVRQWILIISNRYLLLYQPLTLRHTCQIFLSYFIKTQIFNQYYIYTIISSPILICMFYRSKTLSYLVVCITHLG